MFFFFSALNLGFEKTKHRHLSKPLTLVFLQLSVDETVCSSYFRVFFYLF